MADSNGGERRVRAKRSSRPCDACRRRKSRCMTRSNASICTMCELRQSACTFLGLGHPIRKPRRGDDAGGTIAAPPTPGPGRISQVDSTGGAPEYLGGSLSSDPVPSPEVAGGMARPFPTADPAATTASVGSLGCERSRFAELYGLTSDSEPIMMRHRPYNTTDHEYHLDTYSIRRVSRKDAGMEYPVLFHMVSDTRAAGFVEDQSEVDGIEAVVHPFGPRLIRLYWLLVHPSFPILHQKGFMDQFSESYRNVPAALLGAVCLKALAWWSYDSELSLRPPPNAARLQKLTLDAIQNSFHRPRLDSIEAMLVYLHCNLEPPLTPDHTFARGLTSQTLAVAEALGLHVDASGWAIPGWERAQRKRLSWALYMQDKWTALAHGRPSHIIDENWDVRDLCDADFEEEHDDTFAEDGGRLGTAREVPGKAQFVLMIDLTRLLSRAISAFFTVRASRDQDTSGLLEKARPILQDLAAWRQRLLVTTLPMSTARPRQLCSAGYIHLCYYGVVINIFRRLVRSTALEPLCSEPAVLSAIRQQASQTAHEANNFVSSLRIDHLESFWYFPTPYLFALVGSFHTLLLVTSLSATERDYWRETLTSLLWTMRVMSKASDPMRYAVNRLEGGVLRGLEHALAVNVNSPPPAPAGSPDLEKLLRQLEAAQYTSYSGIPDFDLQSFDWLAGVQI